MSVPFIMAMRNNEQRDVKWVEGLRGITAATIVTSHIFRSIFENLASPTSSASSFPLLFQLPFFRLVITGRASLSFFFILTGFVNSLNFLKQVRAGNPNAALAGIAKSSFRRIGRIILPATAATVVSWVLCQMGLYQLARKGDVNWFRDISPPRSPSFKKAIWDLVYNIYRTWGNSTNDFDKVQWNLFFLLKGSLIVYTILLMTTHVTPSSRKVVLFCYYMFGWMSGDVLIAMNISAGMFIAELYYDQADSKPLLTSPRLAKAVPIATLVIGIIVAGYPENNPEWCFWSNSLRIIGRKIFRQGAELSRNWGSVGASLIMVGILFLPSVKVFLAHPFLVWTGKVSFAVFLIHSFLVRSVFCSMLYWHSALPENRRSGENGHARPLQHASGVNLLIISCIFFPFLYFVAQIWCTHVESRCGQIVQWVEDRMQGKDLQVEKGRLPS